MQEGVLRGQGVGQGEGNANVAEANQVGELFAVLFRLLARLGGASFARSVLQNASASLDEADG